VHNPTNSFLGYDVIVYIVKSKLNCLTRPEMSPELCEKQVPQLVVYGNPVIVTSH